MSRSYLADGAARAAKLELEALSNKNFSFITETYLPRKLKEKRWLD